MGKVSLSRGQKVWWNRNCCCSWCFLGAQTRGTQNECRVSMLYKLRNICCGHKMFMNKIRNIFCVPDTKFVSTTNAARASKRGNVCVRNNSCGYTSLLPEVTQWVIALGWDRFGFPLRFSPPFTL